MSSRSFSPTWKTIDQLIDLTLSHSLQPLTAYPNMFFVHQVSRRVDPFTKFYNARSEPALTITRTNQPCKSSSKSGLIMNSWFSTASRSMVVSTSSWSLVNLSTQSYTVTGQEMDATHQQTNTSKRAFISATNVSCISAAFRSSVGPWFSKHISIAGSFMTTWYIRTTSC